MRGDRLGWWIAKALFSAVYWLAALWVAVGLFFGDRYPPLPPDEQTASDWAARGFAVAAVLLYALFSHGWNRFLSQSSDARAE